MPNERQSITFRSIDASNAFEVEEARQMMHGIIISNNDLPEKFDERWQGKYKTLAEFFAGFEFFHFILVDDAYAGFFIYDLNNESLAPEEGYLDSLFLKPQYRGAGLGRHVMGAIEYMVAEAGKTKLTLQSKLGHEDNTRIYAALGFTCLGPKPDRPDRIKWVKTLKP